MLLCPWDSQGKNTKWVAVPSSRGSSRARDQTHIFYVSCIGRPEKAMAPHSSTLAWKIPWTEEPGGLQSIGSLRVGHDWGTSLSTFTFMHWRRRWQPTSVFLPGESQERGSLVGCPQWGHTESATTEATSQQQQQHWQAGPLHWHHLRSPHVPISSTNYFTIITSSLHVFLYLSLTSSVSQFLDFMIIMDL